MTEVAVYEGRLVAWVPGRLRNPLNGSQGMTRGGRIMRSKERASWRQRTKLCVTDALNRAGVRTREGARISSKVWLPRDRKLIVLTAYVWNLYDPDALGGVMKPVVDGLRDAEVIHADDAKSGHRIEHRQMIDRKHRGVEVVVQPRPWNER